MRLNVLTICFLFCLDLFGQSLTISELVDLAPCNTSYQDARLSKKGFEFKKGQRSFPVRINDRFIKVNEETERVIRLFIEPFNVGLLYEFSDMSYLDSLLAQLDELGIKYQEKKNIGKEKYDLIRSSKIDFYLNERIYIIDRGFKVEGSSLNRTKYQKRYCVVITSHKDVFDYEWFY